jgi:hypothetical protein
MIFADSHPAAQEARVGDSVFLWNTESRVLQGGFRMARILQPAEAARCWERVFRCAAPDMAPRSNAVQVEYLAGTYAPLVTPRGVHYPLVMPWAEAMTLEARMRHLAGT